MVIVTVEGDTEQATTERIVNSAIKIACKITAHSNSVAIHIETLMALVMETRPKATTHLATMSTKITIRAIPTITREIKTKTTRDLVINQLLHPIETISQIKALMISQVVIKLPMQMPLSSINSSNNRITKTKVMANTLMLTMQPITNSTMEDRLRLQTLPLVDKITTTKTRPSITSSNKPIMDKAGTKRRTVVTRISNKHITITTSNTINNTTIVEHRVARKVANSRTLHSSRTSSHLQEEMEFKELDNNSRRIRSSLAMKKMCETTR